VQLLKLMPTSERYLLARGEGSQAVAPANVSSMPSSSTSLQTVTLEDLSIKIEEKWAQVALSRSSGVSTFHRATNDWLSADASILEQSTLSLRDTISALAKTGLAADALNLCWLLDKQAASVRDLKHSPAIPGSEQVLASSSTELCVYSLVFFGLSAVEAAATLQASIRANATTTTYEMQSLLNSVKQMLHVFESAHIYADTASADVGSSLNGVQALADFVQGADRSGALQADINSANTACYWLQTNFWSFVLDVLRRFKHLHSHCRLHVCACVCLLEHFPHLELPEQLIDSFDGDSSSENYAGVQHLIGLLLEKQRYVSACLLSTRLVNAHVGACSDMLSRQPQATKTRTDAVSVCYSLFDRLILACEAFLASNTQNQARQQHVEKELSVFKACLDKYFSLLIICEATAK
jgi:hypothetical protein